MDEFRAPRGQSASLLGTEAAGVTQTPLQTTAAPAANPGVNASLLGGFTPLQPVPVPVRVTPPVAPQQRMAQPSLRPQSTELSQVRDFTMPRPQTIAQEVAVMTQSAAAAQALETMPAAPTFVAPVTPEAVAPAAPVAASSSFDIATILDEEKPKNRLRGRLSLKKWALGGGVVSLSLLLGTGGLLFAQSYNSAHKVFRGTGASASLASAQTTKLKGEDAGRVNILLLGNGGIGHEAPDLTDTMILASIDTVHHTATMLSVPRDLWVQMPGNNPTKINAAYEIGKYNSAGKIDNTNDNTKAVEAGFASADQVVQTVLGVNINYNMLVNFTSFKQAVDAVGGIAINVPEMLYDPTMAAENGGNPVLAAAGEQFMDGTKALQYVRSRETSSDFARAQRQRGVILALKSRVLSAGTLSNPVKVSNLVNAFGDNLVSDMSLSEGMRAYSLIKAIDNAKIQTLDLVTPPNNLITTGTIQNASIDLPRAGLFSYADIQKYIQSIFNPAQTTTTATAASSTATTTAGAAATSTPENPQLSVLNGTTHAGLAGTQAATLHAAGYAIAQTGNAPSQAYAKTVVVDLSKGANPKTKQYLESQYGVTAVTQLPDAAIQPGSANFVVILGSDQVH